jgi:hypothetical protein
MSEGKHLLPVIAIIIGLTGIALGGYAILGMLNNRSPDFYIYPKAKAFFDGGGYSLQDSSMVKLDFTDIAFDSHDAFNTTSDTYIIPETGFYIIIAQFTIEANISDLFSITIMANMQTNGSYACTASAYTNHYAVSIETILKLTEGDAITIWVYFYCGYIWETRSIYPGEAFTFFTIAKLP